MLSVKKFSCLLEAVFLVLCHVLRGGNLVAAAVRNDKENSLYYDEDHSSNQIPLDDDAKPKFVDENVYYLPKQTVFGSSSATSGNGVPITSPPHLNINPAPMQTSHQQISSSILQGREIENDDYIIPYQSHCVSETPSINVLESRLVLPSEAATKESVIMSGRIGIASKTSSESEIRGISNVISQASRAMQGTRVHAHSVTDM